MSASVTGDAASPLVQLFRGPPKNLKATAPASCTASASRSRSRRCTDDGGSRESSDACNRQSFQPERRRVGAVSEVQIVRGRRATENVGHVPRDSYLAHRIGALALLDPEA